jgi:hypothetical protein
MRAFCARFRTPRLADRTRSSKNGKDEGRARGSRSANCVTSTPPGYIGLQTNNSNGWASAATGTPLLTLNPKYEVGILKACAALWPAARLSRFNPFYGNPISDGSGEGKSNTTTTPPRRLCRFRCSTPVCVKMADEARVTIVIWTTTPGRCRATWPCRSPGLDYVLVDSDGEIHLREDCRSVYERRRMPQRKLRKTVQGVRARGLKCSHRCWARIRSCCWGVT